MEEHGEMETATGSEVMVACRNSNSELLNSIFVLKTIYKTFSLMFLCKSA